MINLISLKFIFVIICSYQVTSRTNRNEAVYYPISHRNVATGIPKTSQSQQVSHVALQPYDAAGSKYGRNHGHRHHHHHDHHGSPSHHGHGQGYGKVYGHNNGHGHGGHKKGYDSGFRKGHGYKGKKGYKDTTGHNKKAHGDFGKSNQQGYFDNGGKLYKGHKHKNKYYGDIHKGVTGKKGHHLGTKGHRNKGHKDKGFKNVYHKEEFHHNKKFYDDHDNKKYHNKYDDYDSFTKGHKGNDYEGGLYKGGFHNDKYGSKGENQDAKYHDNDVNHKENYGHKKYYGDDHKHGHKKGHKAGHLSDHGHGHHNDHHEHHYNDHPHHHDHGHGGHHDQGHHHSHDHHYHDPHWLAHESEINAQEHAHHDYDHHHQGAHSQNKPIEASKEILKPEITNIPPKPTKYLLKSKQIPIKETIHYGTPSKELPASPVSHYSKPTNHPSNVIQDTNSRFPPSTKSTSSYYTKSHYKPTKFSETHSDTKFLKPEHFSTINSFDTALAKPYSSHRDVHLPKQISSNTIHSNKQNGFKPLPKTNSYDLSSKPIHPKNPFYSDNTSSYSNNFSSTFNDPSLYSNNVYSEKYPQKKILSKKPKFKIAKFSKSGKYPHIKKVPTSTRDKFKNSIFVAIPHSDKSTSKNDNSIIVTAGYNVNKRDSPIMRQDNDISYLENNTNSSNIHHNDQRTIDMPDDNKTNQSKNTRFAESSSDPLALESLSLSNTVKHTSLSTLKPKPYSGFVKKVKLPNFDSFGDFAKISSLSR